MSLVLGCDTGLSNFGVALVDASGTPTYLETFHTKKKVKAVLQDRQERTAILAEHLNRLLERYPVTHISMEMPHRAPNLTGIITTTLAVGMVITLATLWKIPVTPVGARQVRKKVFGNDKIDDEHMYELLLSNVKIDFTNTPKSRQEHALDAFATARYYQNLPLVEVPHAKRTRKKL